MMQFEGKNVLVAGGSKGIGLSLVCALARNGASVYSLSRSSSSLWPETVRHLQFDILGDLSGVPSALPDTLHGLVYSIGSITLKPFMRLTEEDFLTDYRINVLGAVRLLQQTIPALKAPATASVVLVSSVAAQVGMGFHSSVAAAKSAVQGLALSLAAELSPFRIRVNVVSPSLTATPLAQQLLATPEKKRRGR